MLGGGTVKDLYELVGQGASVRAIARRLGLSRNTVRKYLRSPGVPKFSPGPPRPSKLETYREHLLRRVRDGVENCVVLLRELKEQGYGGSYTILKEFVQPLRVRSSANATMRFETEPGEQAQVDFGSFLYLSAEGIKRRVWGFVMVLSWSRMAYVEFVRRADVGTFIRCHINAFEALGGMVRRCLYDNAKIVVLHRDGSGRPVWNERFLDFSLRLGFEVKLCRLYRAQTKGRVESGVGYVKGNFWPTARFADLPDLNRQARVWLDTVANVRIHGTTHERPDVRWEKEKPILQALPGRERLVPFLREDRLVGRDGYVSWDRSHYGVPWTFAAKTVQVQAGHGVVELFSADERIAVHPMATRAAQRLTLPGQWAGLPIGENKPRKEVLGLEQPAIEVYRRPLSAYEALVTAGGAP